MLISCLSYSASTFGVCLSTCTTLFFWSAACSIPSDKFSDRFSEYSWPLPVIYIQLFALLLQGWVSHRASCFNIMIAIVVSLFEVCGHSKLLTNVNLFFRPYDVRCTKLDERRCDCNIERWATQLHYLDWTDTLCKWSWSLGYMPCTSNPEKYWYLSASSSWPSTSPTEWSLQWLRVVFHRVSFNSDLNA